MEEVRVNLGDKSYDIKITDSFLNLTKSLEKIQAPKKILIVTDSNVEKLYGEEVLNILKNSGYDAGMYAFGAGEENKNINSILGICTACLEHGLDRKSLIIALGGGVVGDMAGFAAAIYMRGIDFVQIPTTLLSQSDSSVGGKTGIDFMQSKNILGSFHQPKLVYINVSVLKTLPEREFVSGMGEVIKHGIIRDKTFFDFLKENCGRIKNLESECMIKTVKRNCEIKASVVEEDEKESGLRAILNFGHTIGHAVESVLNFELTHGECVGLGMIAASNIAYNRNLISDEEKDKITEIMEMYNFRTKVILPSDDEIMHFMHNDKKKLDGKLKFVLPDGIGKTIMVTDVNRDEICGAISAVRL